MTRKLLSLVVAALMVLALVPFGAAADDTVTVTLTAADVWEDGTGYQMLLDADANTYGTIFPTSGPLTDSGDASAEVYAEFEYKIPENADGACSTANIVCDASATITIPAGTYDWCIANPDPGYDKVWIASEGGYGGRADDFVFEAGHTYEFRVSLGADSHDRTDLYIDGELFVPPAPPLPEGCVAGYYFEREEELDHVYGFDMDGDSYGWYWDSSYSGSLGAYEGSGVLSSASYASGVGALSPDNWVFFESIAVPSTGATATFWATGYSSYYYDEPFEAYIVPASVVEDESFPDNLATLTPYIPKTTANYAWTEYEVDFAGYEGQEVFLAIRHFDCNDIWRLSIDQVEFWAEPEVEPPAEYQLMIYYLRYSEVLEDWVAVQTAYTATVTEGDAYDVTALIPGEIDGYVLDHVDGDLTGTVAGNITISAYYVEPETPTVLLGDVDCDGFVTMADVTLLSMYLNGENPEITEQGMLNANANEDDGVDIRDIAAIYAIISAS